MSREGLGGRHDRDEPRVAERGAAKRAAVGRHGVITGEEARRKAAPIVARIEASEDPVAELAERWLEEGPRTISPSPEAAAVLAAVPRVDGSPFAIPGRIKGKAMRNLNDPRATATLPGRSSSENRCR